MDNSIEIISASFSLMELEEFRDQAVQERDSASYHVWCEAITLKNNVWIDPLD